MFFSNGVSIKNIVWLIEAFALCTPAVNRSRYARKARWNSYSRSGSPFLPGALLGEDRDIYRRKLSRSGADRGFPAHGFVGAVVKAKAAKQISKMFGNHLLFWFFIYVFPLELRMLARTYFFTAAVFSLILKHILINESKEEILLTFGLARFCR